MDFFEICTSDRYHRDMKILKMLASNSKRLRFYSIFKKWKIGNGNALANILNTTSSQITSAQNKLWSWKLSWVSFLTQKFQKWYVKCSKTYCYWAIRRSYQIYHAVYICKKEMWQYTWVNVCYKMSSSSFLIHSQSSIEVRQFFSTNFIEILVSDYTVHRTFVWEKVCHFWEIERRIILTYRWQFV